MMGGEGESLIRYTWGQRCRLDGNGWDILTRVATFLRVGALRQSEMHDAFWKRQCGKETTHVRLSRPLLQPGPPKKKSSTPGCLNDKCTKRSRLGVQQKAELSAELIQRLTQGGSSGTYVLHRTGRTQEDNQLLHQARGWLGACRRQDR